MSLYVIRMNILITGATGFVGKNLSKALKKSGHSVYALARPSSDLTFLNTEGVFIFDNNIAELSGFLKSHNIDGVIHLAALVVPEHKDTDVLPLVMSNVYLGTAVIDACKQAGTKWFLNTGTIWQNYESPDFSDEYHPMDLYAATKQAFISIAQYYTETSDLKFCTLKLCDTYGPGDTRRKIFTLFEEIAKTGKTLDMSPGEQCLDILHIDDVVSGFVHLAEMMQRGDDVRQEYVLSSGKRIPLRALADSYSSENHVKLNINWGGRPYRQREVMMPYKGHVLDGWHASKKY